MRRARRFGGPAAMWVLVALVALVAFVALVACGGGDEGRDGALDLPEGAADGEISAGEVEERAEAASEEILPDPSVEIRLERGIDVSSHSGTVDWRQVEAAGFDFAFVKATEGEDLLDPAFDRHWRALGESGLVRGAYHFYVTEDEPEAQFEFFSANLVLEPGDLAPVVDIELLGHGTEPGLVDRLHLFLDLLEGHYGVRPILYTGSGFWDRHLDDSFGEFPLWVAEYEVDEPTVPTGWSTWTLWQYQGDATVAGVEKGADLSRANDDGLDLRRLLYLGDG